MGTSLFSKTPSVTVFNNRGLTVRDIVYCRHPDDLEITDERITRHQYDARGFLTQSADPRLHDAGRANFTFITDLTGSVLRSQGTDNGTIVSLNDAAGRPFITVSNIGTTGNGTEDRSQSVTLTWQYEDAALPGRLLSVTGQNSDEAARMSERFVYAGSTDAEKALNLAGQCVSHYDTAGLIQTDSVALSGGPLSVTRRLLKEADNPDAAADWQGADASVWDKLLASEDERYITQTTTDATGAVLTTTDAKGNLQRVIYDVAGLLAASWLTPENGMEQTIVKSLTYSAAGQKLREEHGNGVVTAYTYEAETQRLTGIKTERPTGHTSGAKVLQDLRYEYDPVGNVLKISNDAEKTRFWRNQKVVPENTYTYDSLYQLVSAGGRELAAGQPGSSLPPAAIPIPTDPSVYTCYTRTYSYDRGGNLTQISHRAPATKNTYTSTITVSERSNRGVLSSLAENAADVDALFMAGGQQLLLPGQNLIWTPRNELLSVTPVVRDGSKDDRESYRYDAGSQRLLKISVQKTGNSIQTRRALYLPGLELRNTKKGDTETDSLQVITVGASGRAQVRMLRWERGAPGGIGNQLRWSYDNLTGSSGLEVDGDGNVITLEEFYPYGGTAILAARSQVEVDYRTVRYSGKERDATGLYYYGYRYYQPWAGRWLSADPASEVDGLNLFRMVRNNPTTLKDDNGLISFEDNYNCSEGGMIYGLSDQRSQYTRKIIPKFSISDNSDTLVIDKYNNALAMTVIFGEHSKTQNQQINLDFYSAMEDKIRKSLGAKIKVPKEIIEVVKRKFNHPAFKWDDYFSPGIDNPKFNIHKIYKQVAKNYGHDYYHGYQMAGKGYLVPRLLWKRGSKLGIEMAAQKRNVIHFVIDGIIMDDVVHKKGDGGFSVTASELRYAFRNRERLNGSLFFYENGVLTSPPWQSASTLWKAYGNKNAVRGNNSDFMSVLRKSFRRK